MMKITNIYNYDGKYSYNNGTFEIMVDEGDAFVSYVMTPSKGATEESRWLKKDLDNAKDFPEAVGKFIPELVSLIDPIPISEVPSYTEAQALISSYLEKYGASF